MATKYFKNMSVFQKVIFSLIILFFVFNLSLLISSWIIDTNDLKHMVKMARYISYMKYVVIINMVLFTIIIAMYYAEIKKLKKNNEQSENDMIRIKSTLYDIEKNKSDYVQKI